MDFSALIKKSFQFAWTNKILWIFGFLSGGAGTIGYLDPTIFTYSFGGSDNPFKPEIQENGEKIASNILGATDRSFSSVATETWVILALIGALVVLVFVLIVIFVTNWASASLVFSILNRNIQKPSFGVGAQAGLRYWWKYYLLSLVISLFVLAILLLLALPILILFLAGLEPLAMVFLVLGLIVFIILIFLISVVGTLVITISQRMIIHKGTGVLESLRLSGGLLKKYIGDSLLTYLVALGLGFASSFVIMMAVFPIALVLFVLFVTKLWMIALILLVPAILVLLVAGGFWQTFTVTYWTLFYEHLAAKEGW